jgi:cobalt-zinc-cadmium efflux system outer membrane protein
MRFKSFVRERCHALIALSIILGTWAPARAQRDGFGAHAGERLSDEKKVVGHSPATDRPFAGDGGLTEGRAAEPRAGMSERSQSQPESHDGPIVPSDVVAASLSWQETTAGPEMRLEDLERMALQNNPTLAQAEAAVRAAEGRRVQAGLYPNPTVGYQGEEFSTRAFSQKSEHFFFIEQSFPLGGKLRKSRDILAREKTQAETDAAAQRQRVLNAVRMLYYEALGAQQLVQARAELAKVAREAVGTSEELFNLGQADRPDLFAAEIEAQRAQLDLVMAENHRDQIWQQLGAITGNPSLRPARLAGNLERGLPVIDQEAALAAILRDSPELRRAQAGIERARAALSRAKAEPVPDLFVRGGFGYSSETLELRNGGNRLAQPTGPEGSIEVGIRLPVFNRNQGNIAAARAEMEIAEREARRVELALRSRLASAFRAYQNALRIADQYERQVIPRAQRAYDLYLAGFQQMAAAYPQVLIAQRTLFQVRAEYINALVDAWRNAIQLQGLLLTGGLDAPASAQIEGGRGASEGPGVRAGMQGAGIEQGDERRNQ